MLRTNLSTRPFYNERLVLLVLIAAAAVVVALTAFNAWRLQVLTSERSALVGRIRAAEEKTASLKTQRSAAERAVNREQLEQVVAAAREANDLIDQRTFSWTELLNRLEATLPDAVRIQAIRPAIDDDGRMMVELVAVARQPEDVETFIEQLEATGGFRDVVLRSEATDEDGSLEVALGGLYRPSSAAKAGR